MHLPAIISDLAMILLVAGITTILFKKINQPLVLGYIIAGFITGSNFQYFPTVADSVNISTWSEIGVIFLLFALGLEFSFYKLKSVGSTAFIGTTCEIFGMLFMGYVAGKCLGWNDMDSVFLGGMLSMSSTTIIIKAFEDLGMRGKSFTEIVFGMLIVEDIAGIVMMVMLSTIATASSGISSAELAMSVARLIFFLVLWFVCGMYLIPSFYKKTKNLMNEEMLVVVSIGLCLGMAVLATHMGFSSALGAFIMGSLIAEAPNLHTIEHLVKPVKDLFGAVFFVSVGMLVNPVLLIEYWFPIIIIILVTIIGKLIFSTSGVLLGGQSLQNSVHAGFSLAQIGEFSFIIAGLGTSLGVTSEFLYPIIVAVSVLTTFTTPYFINSAEYGYTVLRKILPKKIISFLDKNANTEKVIHNGSDWQNYLLNLIIRMIISVTLLVAIIVAGHFYLIDFTASFIKTPYHFYMAALLTILIMSPILRVLTLHANNDSLFTVLWLKNKANKIPLTFLAGLKFVIALAAIGITLVKIAKINLYIVIPLTFVVIYYISKSNWLLSQYLNIKSHFLINLNAKHIEEYRLANGISNSSYFGNELKLGYYRLTENSNLASKTLIESKFRLAYGCNILQIKNKDKTIDLPDAKYIFQMNDTLLLVGTNEQFRILKVAIENNLVGLEEEKSNITLAEFTKTMDTMPEEHRLYPYSILVDENTGLIGKTMRSQLFRNNLKGTVIGVIRGSYTIVDINPDLEFQKNDLIWLMGKKDMIRILVKQEML
ncbi:MAG: cation:proton antiporter [Acidaminococcaceae bacterium]|nr:cation:proton antiporter [Acidaminococcaceae bacterium]MDO4935403.1 cation:proton antiporter [Phascolarctobacterium sp.]